MGNFYGKPPEPPKHTKRQATTTDDALDVFNGDSIKCSMSINEIKHFNKKFHLHSKTTFTTHNKVGKIYKLNSNVTLIINNTLNTDHQHFFIIAQKNGSINSIQSSFVYPIKKVIKNMKNLTEKDEIDLITNMRKDQDMLKGKMLREIPFKYRKYYIHRFDSVLKPQGWFTKYYYCKKLNNSNIPIISFNASKKVSSIAIPIIQ